MRPPSLAALASILLLSSACRHAAPASGGAPSARASVEPALAVTEESSGSRLKVVWAVGPAGERVFWAWYDTKLQVECLFDVASDGKKRCLPANATWVGSSFADSACKVPALRFYGPVSSRYYKLRTPTCPPRVTVGLLGAELPLESLFSKTTFKRTAKSGAASFEPMGCGPALTAGVGTAFALGDPIPLETFAAAEIRRGDTVGPVGLTMLDSEDGSRDVSSWFDNRLGVECAFDPAADGVVRCLPRTLAAIWAGFSDDQCSTPAASMATRPSSCQQVYFVRAQAPNECPRRTHVFRGGPRLATAYEDYGSSACQLSTDEHYQVGPELAPAEFAPGTSRTWRAGSGPLAVQLEEAGGKIKRRHFVDQRFDLPCYANKCKGDTRCVPPADSILSDAYGDPECQQPLVGRKPGTCMSRMVHIDHPLRGGAFVTGGCSQPFYVVGPRHEGPVYRRIYRVAHVPVPGETLELDDARASCVQATPSGFEEFYRIERKVERSDLIQLHFETR